MSFDDDATYLLRELLRERRDLLFGTAMGTPTDVTEIQTLNGLIGAAFRAIGKEPCPKCLGSGLFQVQMRGMPAMDCMPCHGAGIMLRPAQPAQRPSTPDTSHQDAFEF